MQRKTFILFVGLFALPVAALAEEQTLPAGIDLGLYCREAEKTWAAEISRTLATRLLAREEGEDPDQLLWRAEGANRVAAALTKRPDLLARLWAVERGDISDREGMAKVFRDTDDLLDSYRWANCFVPGTHFERQGKVELPESGPLSYRTMGDYVCKSAGDADRSASSSPSQTRSLEWRLEKGNTFFRICDKKAGDFHCLNFDLDGVLAGRRYETDPKKAESDIASYSKTHPARFAQELKKRKAASPCAHYPPRKPGQGTDAKPQLATDQGSAPAKPADGQGSPEAADVGAAHAGQARTPSAADLDEK